MPPRVENRAASSSSGAATARPATIAIPLVTAPVVGPVEPGDVLTIDPGIPGGVKVADRSSDHGAAGCAATPPEGVGLPAGDVAIGVAGIYLCRADAQYGSIAVGDLLTTSENPGHARRAGDTDDGSILGKAMEPLEAGMGLIRVLVSLR